MPVSPPLARFQDRDSLFLVTRVYFSFSTPISALDYLHRGHNSLLQASAHPYSYVRSTSGPLSPSNDDEPLTRLPGVVSDVCFLDTPSAPLSLARRTRHQLPVLQLNSAEAIAHPACLFPHGLQRTCPTPKVQMVPFQVLRSRWKSATTTRSTTIWKMFNTSCRPLRHRPFPLGRSACPVFQVSLVPITFGPLGHIDENWSNSDSQYTSLSDDFSPNSH